MMPRTHCFWNATAMVAALSLILATGSKADEEGWFAFNPKADKFAEGSAIDLRFLNEKVAGENGFIGVKDGAFIHTGSGKPERFWAVNGPPEDLHGAKLKECARRLAKYGVNLVRVHIGYFDPDGAVDLGRVRKAHEIVAAMKAEGIYTHFSVYFPLWLSPKAGLPWLRGYDGAKHPFAALFFNPDFQAQYRSWWRALLKTPAEGSGKTLVEEPAVASLEILNEDSFFFWTFAEGNLPGEQWKLLEAQFGDWLLRQHGSWDAVTARWKGEKAARDSFAEGRAGFLPLWNMFSQKTPRGQDTARFLTEVQTKFYSDTRAFLRELGFRGPITASNWSTASPETLGPLEKMSYSAGDFFDRHGYFSCNHKGENAEWSLRNGQTYSDRSALRFEAEEPGKPRQFVHPAMDPHYDGKPSMISETTWNRPNRHRSEAPLYFAAYGALQGSDAIVHFAWDGNRWSAKPNFWMQPWTLMSPAMAGQFPATALIYRKGLLKPGPVLARVDLNKEDLLRLQGTPLPQDSALDELRMKDVPEGKLAAAGNRIDPLVHYAGRTEVRFVAGPGSVHVEDLKPWIDHAARTVRSATSELRLDYALGTLTVNSPFAQGASGNLKAAGMIQTENLIISSDLDLIHILVVSLDGRPLATSGRMLLQVMTEEKTSGFQTAAASEGVKRIVEIGGDPWLVKKIQGSVKFKSQDAAQLRVTALDFNGYALDSLPSEPEIRLQPETLYYLISR